MSEGERKLIFTAEDTLGQGVCWFAGDYKIVQYEAGYFAYHRPRHAPRPQTTKSCFYDGMNRSAVYDTLEEAQKACEEHLKMEAVRK